MPELPDVEGFRRRFARLATGRTVARVDVEAKGRMLLAPAAAIRRALVGLRLGRTARIGKWMFAEAKGGAWLVLHFGMTGDVAPLDADAAPPPYARLVLRFDGGGGVAFVDPRRFGRIGLAESPEAFAAARGLGPDAAALDAKGFLARLDGRRGGVKAVLMDQSVLAGLGNLWVDEVLWQARLHPRTPLEALDARERRRLHGVVAKVLRTSLKRPGDWHALPDGWLMKHRGRGRCPRCRTPLQRATVAGRTTYWCPKEQAR